MVKMYNIKNMYKVVEKLNGECDSIGLEEIKLESRLKPKYCGRTHPYTFNPY
jgi:hypothetical protein